VASVDQSARRFVAEAFVCSGDECDGHVLSVQVAEYVFQARFDGRKTDTTLSSARGETMVL
jgi:hypothetical protein